jgi:hypothetical protein
MLNIVQHYPPGTQEDYNSFSSRNLIMGKGKELEFPEGRGGGKGEPMVPPNIVYRQTFWDKYSRHILVCMVCEKVLEDCLICLETIVKPVNDILLKCDCCKNYHNSCLQRWVDERNSCPICKMIVNNKNQELVVYQYQNEDFERQQFLSLYNYSLRYIFAVIYFYFITFTMCYLIFGFFYNMMVLLVYGRFMG